MVNFELPWEPLFTQTGGEVGVNPTSTFGYWALAATIAFTLAVHFFEGYLDARQKKSYQVTDFPAELEKTVSEIDAERKKELASNKNQDEKTEEKTEDEPKDGDKKKTDHNKPLLPQLQEKFRSAQTYGLDKINFGMIASTYDVIESVLFLILGFLPFIWEQSCEWGARFGWTETENEIKISLIFLFLTTIIGTITSLPFELYSTFQIERKHGFNKQTAGLFFTDKIKSLALTFAIGGPFLALLLKIIKVWKISLHPCIAFFVAASKQFSIPFSFHGQWGGDFFYIYVWVFMFLFSVFMMTVVPVFIMPLFNKYEPLPDGDLKRRIFELAASLKYPLTKLFVMDGSKRSSHSNAFMVSDDVLL